MKIVQIISVAFLFAAFAGCGKYNCEPSDCIDESQINRNAICYDLYAPVCGCDGKTYTNDCEAKNAGVTRWEEGACAGKR